MIKKIDEESHQTEQDQKCISFNTYVALLIHFFQFLKNCMIHFASWASKFLNDELSTDFKYSGLKMGRSFVSDYSLIL